MEGHRVLVITLVFLTSIVTVSAARLRNSGVHLLALSEDTPHHPLTQPLHRPRRDTSDDTSAVEVKRFHVESQVYSRFATVRIQSEVLNVKGASEEIAFSVQVPLAAFMSNFTMTVNGRLYVAQVRMEWMVGVCFQSVYVLFS